MQKTKISRFKIHPQNAVLFRPLTDAEYQSLKESIEEFGIQTPLICDKDFRILDGHHRYKIAQELGIELVPFATLLNGPMTEEEILVRMVDMNVERRHLTPQDIVIIGEILENLVYKKGQGSRTDLKGPPEGGTPNNISLTPNPPVCHSREGGNPDEPQPVDICPQVSKGEKTRDFIGKKLGISGRQLSRYRNIYKKAPQWVVDRLEKKTLKQATALAIAECPEIHNNIDALMTEKYLAAMCKGAKRTRRKDRIEKNRAKTGGKKWETTAEISAISADFFLKGYKGFELAPPGETNIDLIFTDPPFGEGGSDIPINHAPDKIVNRDWDKLDLEWLEYLQNILNPNGQVLINCSIRLAGEFCETLEIFGIDIKDVLIWHKTNPGPLIRNKNKYSNACEAIIWGVRRGAKDYAFTPWKQGENGTRAIHNIIEGPVCNIHERLISDFPQKPMWLAKQLLERHSKPGQRMFDPFAGTGTYLLAGLEAGLHVVGSEISIERADIARQRIGILTTDEHG